MTHRIRDMEKASFPANLAGRRCRWRTTIVPPFGESFSAEMFTRPGAIELPAGTGVRVTSALMHFRLVVVETTEDPPQALYDTFTGHARPSVTAGVFRRTSRGIEVAVVFQKRPLGDVPALKHLADEHGFVLCAEPPGGMIDDFAGHDFLHEVPPRWVIRRTARREVAEEFGELPILSIHTLGRPVCALGAAKSQTYQALVEVEPRAKPRAHRPEIEEQITERKFLPLDTVLAHCLRVEHRGIFWGRACTHTWLLLRTFLDQQDRKQRKK